MATVDVFCPHCRHSYRLSEEKCGARVRCGQCAQVFTVAPAAGGAQTVAFGPGELEAVEPEAPPPPRGDGVPPSSTRRRPVSSRRRRLGGAAGETLGRYRLGAEIGRGGMGAILTAEDGEIGRQVAMKIMLREADRETRDRFRNEARITGQLEHPNIVPVHELGVDTDGQPYFTMKRIEGRSLASILDDLRADPAGAEDRVSLRELLDIFAKVCDALRFAHSRGVIHRDLKPDNIMVGAHGEVLVMDWGLAKAEATRSRVSARQEEPPDGGEVAAPAAAAALPEGEASGTLEGAVNGTPAYMAPEQAEGRLADLDERADIYALGAILYEMLCLHAPVAGETVYDQIFRAANNQIEPLVSPVPERVLPRELCAIAQKCLAREPAARYPTVVALLEDIHLFQEGRSVSAAPDSLLQGLVKVVRRHRGIVATAAGGLAVVLLLGVVSVIQILAERDAAYQAQREAETAQRALLEQAWANAERFAKQALRLLDQGRVREAQHRAEDAEEVCPKAPFGPYAHGKVAQASRQHEAAAAFFEQALQRAPEHRASRLALAASRAYLARLAESEEELVAQGLTAQQLAEAGADVDLDAPGEAAHGPLGEEDEELLALEAELADVQDWRALVQHADLYRKAGREAAALQLYERALPLMRREGAESYRVTEVTNALARSRVAVQCRTWFPERDGLSGPQKGAAIVRMLRRCNPDAIGYRYWHVKVEGARVLEIELGEAAGLRYLQPLRGLNPIRLTLNEAADLVDLEPLRGLPLQHLAIAGATGLRDLGPLVGMPLETLSIVGFQELPELTPLRGLPLRDLTLVAGVGQQSRLGQLAPLKGLALKRLTLGAGTLPDLEVLAGSGLEHLGLSSAAEVDLHFCTALPHLRSLDLDGLPLTSLQPLSGLALTALRLADCDALTSLAACRALPLESLALLNCDQITDLRPLKDCPLETVDLTGSWPFIRHPGPVADLLDPEIQSAVALLYLRDGELAAAARVVARLAERWPRRPATDLALRTLAQIHMQGALPKRFHLVSTTPDRYRKLDPVSLEEAQTKTALAFCTARLAGRLAPRARCVWRMLRARCHFARGELPLARQDLKAILEASGDERFPETVAAAHILREYLETGEEIRIPQLADLGWLEDESEEGLVEDAREGGPAFVFGPTEVVMQIYPPADVYHVKACEVPLDLMLQTSLASPFFFHAFRHALDGRQKARDAALRRCRELDPESSYGRQAAALLQP